MIGQRVQLGEERFIVKKVKQLKKIIKYTLMSNKLESLYSAYQREPHNDYWSGSIDRKKIKYTCEVAQNKRGTILLC